MFTGTQLINGSFTPPSASHFRAVEAASGTVLEHAFSNATTDEVDAACRAAAGAFATYSKATGAQKAQLLENIALQIEALGDELLHQAHRETGLPLARLQGERGRTVGQLRLFAQLLAEGSWVQAVIDPAQPARKPLPKPDVRRMEVPLGPVAVFGASNFPLAFSVAGGDTASALAAGCPVVFKAHPAHPGTCELVAAAIVKALAACGLPQAVFGMVQGAAHVVGAALVQHPAIKAVGFTGSFAGGKALYDLAVRRPEPIPVYAEMGSVNPIFFLPEILAQQGAELAKAFAASITLGVGQFCTNPGLCFLPAGSDADAFVAAVRTELAAAAPAPMLTESIQKAYVQGAARLAQLCGTTCADSVQPYLFAVPADIFVANPHVGEEVFGPCSVAVFVRDAAEMQTLAATLQGQLTATVHGTDSDLEAHRGLLELLPAKAGRVLLNGFPTGVEVTHAMVHGGPFPATTDSRSTSVGTGAIYRFTRPVCFQNYPQALLPEALQDANPLGIMRRVDDVYMR